MALGNSSCALMASGRSCPVNAWAKQIRHGAEQVFRQDGNDLVSHAIADGQLFPIDVCQVAVQDIIASDDAGQIPVMIDDDQDCVWLKVAVAGGASCHVGYRSCFYRRVPVGAERSHQRTHQRTEESGERLLAPRGDVDVLHVAVVEVPYALALVTGRRWEEEHRFDRPARRREDRLREMTAESPQPAAGMPLAKLSLTDMRGGSWLSRTALLFSDFR